MQIRRVITALSLTAALAGSGVVVVAGTAQAAERGCYVKASAATLRSKPSTHSTALGMTYRGNRCSEKGYDYRGSYGWFKVRMISGNAKGRTGWIREDLLHTKEDDIHTCILEDSTCR